MDQNLDGKCPVCYLAFLVVAKNRQAMFCSYCGAVWERPGMVFEPVRYKARDVDRATEER